MLIGLLTLGGHRQEWASLFWVNVGYLQLNRALAQTGSFQPAIAAFTQAVAYQSNSETAWRGMGFALWWNRQPAKARLAWQRSPVMAEELLRWAKLAEKRGELQEALVWYEQVAEVVPAFADPLYYLGQLYQQIGQLDRAEQSYRAGTERTIFEAVNKSAFYFQLGQIKSQQKAFAEASQWYNQAIQTNDFANLQELSQAYLAQAEALKQQEQWVEAKIVLQQLQQINPQSYWANVHLGYLVWRTEGDLEQARQLFQRAIGLQPKQKWAYLGLAAIYQATQQFEQAQMTYEQVLALDPTDTTAHEMLSKLATPTP